MKILKFLFILLLFALFSCSSPSSSGDTTETALAPIIPIVDNPDATADTEPEMVYNIKGKAEKGRCSQDGEVRVQPLNVDSFDQSGAHYTGYTDENGYNIPVVLKADEYSELFFDGWCDDELNGGNNNFTISGIVKNSDPIQNVNPLTKTRTPVARWLFDNAFGTKDECIVEAERLILNYLNMPGIGNRFTAMSIENDSTADAISLMYSLVTLSYPDPGALMVSVANGVKANDLDLKAEILEVYNQIPVFTVIANLKASYGELTKIPPIWRLGHHPTYFADLIENEHTLQGSHNLDSYSGCNVDLPYITYAVPRVFESWIETSKYLATNLDGNLSIWTRGFDEYDRPGTKIIDVERLEGIDLDGPANLVYNGKLGDHGLIDGQEVYFVVTRESGWYLSKGCNADLLPFGRLLASNDGGETWVGSDNNSLFWRKGSSGYGMN